MNSQKDSSEALQGFEEFNYQYIMQWIEQKPDMLSFPDDLGMQNGPMISPALFQRYLKPSYKQIMQPARDLGCIVHMHSDGDIRMLIDDLLDDGVEVINIQDQVNGIDWIADNLAGRICVELDIDRQAVTASGSPQQIHDLIEEEVTKIGSKEGGLTMIYGLYPGVPIENAGALMDAMEKYAFYYS